MNVTIEVNTRGDSVQKFKDSLLRNFRKFKIVSQKISKNLNHFKKNYKHKTHAYKFYVNNKKKKYVCVLC